MGVMAPWRYTNTSGGGEAATLTQAAEESQSTVLCEVIAIDRTQQRK